MRRVLTASIMFTDIVDSTRVLQRLGDVRGERLFREHRALVDRFITAEGGADIKWNGDGVMAAFPSASGAFRAAVAMLQANAMSGQRERLGIRIGLSLGDVISDGSDYHGAAVVVARRLCDHAQPGQILATAAMCLVAGPVAGAGIHPLGTLTLKGLDEPAEVVELRPSVNVAAIPPEAAVVARDPELRIVQERLDAAVGGYGSVLFVAGEPGVGKSRLLRECEELAAGRDVLVLHGRTENSGYAAPFSPILDTLTSYEDVRGPGSLAASLGQSAGALRSLSPRLDACLGPQVQEAAPPDRAEVARTLSAWLSARAREAPLALLLDDVHGAGPETFSFIEHIASGLPGRPLLLVVAYRATEAPEELSSTVQRVLRQPFAKLIPLEPLDAAGVDELVSLLAGPAAAERLCGTVLARSGGNPLFVRELLVHLVESGALRWDGDTWVPTGVADPGLPPGIRAVILRRVARLGPAARSLLAAASACLQPIDMAAAAKAAGLEGGDALDALDECLASGLLRETHEGLDFSHDVVREALLGEMSALRREEVHASLAAAFEHARNSGRSVPSRTLAYHLRLAGMRADRGLLARHGLEAGEEALRTLAFPEARVHFTAVLEGLPPGTGATVDRAEAHHGLGRTCQEEGRLDDALAELSLAADLSATGGRVERTAEYLYYLARLHLVRFAVADAMNALDRANDLLAADEFDPFERDRLRVRINVQLAQGLSFQGRHRDAKQAAEAAVALAATLGRPDYHAEATFARSMADLQALRLDDAGDGFAVYRRLAREDGHHIQELVGANRGALALFYAGRVEEALALAQSARGTALEAGKPLDGAFARITLAAAALLHGEPDRAAAIAREGLLLAGDREPWTNGALGPTLAFAAWLQGDSAGAIAAAERLLSRRERAGDITGLTVGATVSLLIRVLGGATQGERAALRHLVRFVPAEPDLRSIAPVAALAAAAMVLEDEAAAAGLWSPLAACPQVVISPGVPFLMARLEAGLARLLGKTAAAAAAIGRAEASATDLAAPVERLLCAAERARLAPPAAPVSVNDLTGRAAFPGLAALLGRLVERNSSPV